MFKKTQEILNDNSLNVLKVKNQSTKLPAQLDWDYTRKATLKDIVLWEEIYRQPGNIGIYAAWSPYVEFYIIVYELFLGTGYEIETFYGSKAAEDIFKKAKSLGILLEVQKIYIYPWHTPPFDASLENI
jgi:hypothetical protein